MTTTLEPQGKTLKLPDLLRSHHDALVKALAKPIPMEWDEEATYIKAEQPAAIGAVLVRALHEELVNADVAFLFRKKLTDHDRTRLAQASRVSGKLNYFTQLDCLVEVNWEQWVNLSDERRIALIDHELCHFSREVSDEGETKYVLLSHDVEEFSAIVRRWGLWKVDLERFGKAVEKARQLDIFTAIDPATKVAERAD
jgi:hypothetical protein